MDLEKGKEIFYKYNGSKVSIEREVGNEYKKCNVPIEVENEWRQDIMISLLTAIKRSNGADLIKYVMSYIQLLSTEQCLRFLINIIKNRKLDTFTCLLLCETLKDFVKCYNIYLYDIDIEQELKHYKEFMLQNDIIIDESYKSVWYMQDYDFSINSIIQRINNL